MDPLAYIAALKKQELESANNLFRYEDVTRVDPYTAAAQSNHASEFHKRLRKWVAEFDAKLDETQEVGVRLG